MRPVAARRMTRSPPVERHDLPGVLAAVADAVVVGVGIARVVGRALLGEVVEAVVGRASTPAARRLTAAGATWPTVGRHPP
jgi:ribosomal protein L14